MGQESQLKDDLKIAYEKAIKTALNKNQNKTDF